MKNLLVYFLLFAGIGLHAQPHSIIPEPNEISFREGHFSTPDTFYYFMEDQVEGDVDFLLEFFQTMGHAAMQVNEPGQAHIYIKKDSLSENKESYLLEIASDQITIQAASVQGNFYAQQSLIQLFRFENKIPCMVIKDEPRFPYRGMHLDVCRHFFPVSFIKKYIDLLATYKFNTFHWHLTEDQGWRIEIKKYPKLQEVAAFRNETLIGHYNDQPQRFDGKRYGGYYTQKEIREVVAYAADRHITIIPEIEMPGHALAALAAYPELSCTGGPHQVATKWGVFEDVYCPKEATFEFLEGVLDEVMELFPSRYIHIGGDECPKSRWESCEHCQRLIQDKNLQDEHGLQSYFIQRIEKYLNQQGRQIIGWDEILEGGLAPNATVMSWRGTQGGIEAAKSGHGVAMTPTSHCYFDYYQSDNPEEPLAIGGYLPLEKVYSFEPVPPALSTEEQVFILGAQGNVWTEYMPNSDKVEYMVLPRMQAMAEIGWTQSGYKDFTNFIKKLDDHFTWWEAAGYEYADKTLEIKTNYHLGKYTRGLTLETMHPEAEIFYTIGDQEKLILFQKGDTIKIDLSTRIIARASKPGHRVGARKVIEIDYHKGMNTNASLLHAPSPTYSGHGVVSLLNGINGSSEKYGDNEWMGFSGKDLEVILQFENPIALSDFQTRFFHGPGQWIHAPKKVELFTKQQNGLYSLLANSDVKPGGQKITPVQISFPETMVKELKIIVHRYGLIPEGQAGAGHEAWLFVDELRLN